MTTTADRTHDAPPPPGEVVQSHAQALAIPVGTILTGVQGATYEVRERDGVKTLFNTGTDRWTPTTLDGMRTDGKVRVARYPEGFVSPAESPVAIPDGLGSTDYDTEVDLSGRETLGRYKQRFKTTIYGRATRAGINFSYAENAMRVLEVPEVEPTPGMVIYGSDTRTMNRMPNGTVMAGGVPGAYGHWSVLGKAGNAWSTLAGGADSNFVLYTVDTVPGVETPAEWVTQPAAVEDERLIWDFKQAAERVGARAQSETGWCGEYGASMRSAGVDSRIHRNPYIPPFTAEQVSERAQGTVYRVEVGAYDFVLMVRDDASTNPARTRRLVGTIPGAWASGMREAQGRRSVHLNVLGLPPLMERWIVVGSGRELDRVPVGTMITDNSTVWRKQERRHGVLWYRLNRDGSSRDDYAYSGRDFTHGDMAYITFGDEA